MQTYGELVYLILDELKLTSDDGQFEEDHIITLINQYRNLLLKQRYSDIRKEIPVSNLQSVNITLVINDNTIEVATITNTHLKSTFPLPVVLNLNAQNVTKINNSNLFWNGEFSFIDYGQFKYIGYNKWLNSIIYISVGPDNYVYARSNNQEILNLTSLTITSIFEDPIAVYKLSSPIDNTSDLSILDMVIPVEGNLISIIKELVIKELSPVIYKPNDEVNNSADDLNKMGVK